MAATINEQIEDRATKALSSDNVPKLYINGFIIFFGQGDIGLVFEQNNKPTATVNMSYTLAKTLVEKLGNTIRDFEEKTGNIIMTTDYIAQKMNQESADESNKQ
jgi:hypothetical protein